MSVQMASVPIPSSEVTETNKTEVCKVSKSKKNSKFKTPEFIEIDSDSDLEDFLPANSGTKADHIQPVKKVLNKKFKCSKCKYCTHHSPNLKRHLKTHEKEETEGRYGTLLCPEGECNKSFTSLNYLDGHLESSHGRKIEIEELSFKDYFEFQKWMCELRITESFGYVKKGACSKKSHIYYCHRSGQFPTKSTSTGKRRPRKAGSIKSKKICTSRIRSQSTESGIQVTYFKTHSGHEIDPGRVGLSSQQKRRLNDLKSKSRTQEVDSLFQTARTMAVDAGMEGILSDAIKNAISLMQSRAVNLYQPLTSTIQDKKPRLSKKKRKREGQGDIEFDVTNYLGLLSNESASRNVMHQQFVISFDNI